MSVFEPKAILSNLSSILDLAEERKGQKAILKKVTVVTKAKGQSGNDKCRLNIIAKYK